MIKIVKTEDTLLSSLGKWDVTPCAKVMYGIESSPIALVTTLPGYCGCLQIYDVQGSKFFDWDKKDTSMLFKSIEEFAKKNNYSMLMYQHWHDEVLEILVEMGWKDIFAIGNKRTYSTGHFMVKEI